MASRKKLVLLVEGEGDQLAVPVLVKRILTEQGAWQYLALDEQPRRIRGVGEVTRNDCQDWVRKLQAISTGSNVGGVLLLLDGESGRLQNEEFCPVLIGRRLAERAREAGAGRSYSLSVVFARQEYESWILACIRHLVGTGRIPEGIQPPAENLEESPRDAKGWLDEHIESGYKPTRDQESLTRMMLDHLDAVRERMPSYRRLENALRQIVDGIRTGNHVSTPGEAPP